MFRLQEYDKSKDDEDDDDYYSSMEPSPFFYIPESAEVAPSEIPTDGFEYLQLVKREREECPTSEVSSFEVPKKQNKLNSQRYVPTNEDRKFMRSIFFNARWLVQSKVLKKSYPLNNGEQLPFKNDMLGWCAFCLGKKAMSQLNQNSDHRELEYNFHPDGYEPYLRFVCSMSKTEQVKLLSFIEIWLKQFGFSRRLGLWMYALLLVLERPLIQYAEDVLSYLAGTCVSVRPRLKDDDEALNIYRIICAINGYFGCNSKKITKSDVKPVDKTIVKSDPIHDAIANKCDTSSENSESSSDESVIVMEE